MKKTCITCDESKDFNLFPNDKSRSDGKRPECKSCKSARDKIFRATHADKKKALNKVYYEDNAEKLKANSRKWYEDNKERSKKTKAKYYQNNKAKMDAAKKKWHEKNKEKMREWVNIYMKNRYHNDLDYRIKSLMNKRIRDYIRSKTKKTLDFLG